jgi:dihydrofolate reductase
MGKIIISENVTLDGVIQDATAGSSFRHAGWFDRSLGQDRAAWADAEFQEARSAEALLLGRRTYEYFVAVGWQSRPGAWADTLRSLPKYVVSATLDELSWDNTTVLAGDFAAVVSELKDKLDGDIVVYGSGQLAHALIEHDLADEVRLMVFPCVLGDGERLFAALSDEKAMRLAGTRTVGSGLVHLTYRAAAA